MAWSDAWDAETVYIGARDLDAAADLPSVKHLLADVCNAVNERAQYLWDARHAWGLPDLSTNDAPEPDDFKGLKVELPSDGGANMPATAADIITQVKGLLAGTEGGGPGYATDDTFGARWTWDSILDDVGGLDADGMEARNAWRRRAWWDTLRGVLERLRYLSVDCALSHTGGDLDNSDLALADPTTDIEAVWDSLGDSTSATPIGDPVALRYRNTGGPSYSGAGGTWYSELALDYYGAGDDAYVNNYFQACPAYTVQFDSDYKRGSGSGMDAFGAARTYPAPKELIYASLFAVRVLVEAYIIWSGSYQGGTHKPNPLDPEAAQPDLSIMSINCTLDGHSMSGLQVTGASQPPELPRSREYRYEIPLNTGGEVDFLATTPADLPSGVLPAPGYTPDNGVSVAARFELRVRVAHIEARFDLNDAFDYPAA